MKNLSIGDKAPDFKLLARQGHNVPLKNFLNKKNVILYFYPKDDTPGCTVQACGFRDTIKRIEAQDTIVLGVSPDNPKSHEKFITKFNLPFLLLSDEDHNVSNAYGVWVEKNMYGRKYMGIERTTFVIDKSGKIAQIFSKVKPQGHDQEVLDFIGTLSIPAIKT